MKRIPSHRQSKPDDADQKTAVSQKPVGRYLTVKQLAARWQISPRQVHRIIADGELRVHRFGRSVRIALDDIELFELRHRSQLLSTPDSP